MTDLELKPCPFCAAEMQLIPALSDPTEFVAKHPGDIEDEDCLLSGCGLHPNKWVAWNTRPEAADTLSQMRAALAEVRSMEVRGFPRSEIIDEIDAALTTPKIEKAK